MSIQILFISIILHTYLSTSLPLNLKLAYQTKLFFKFLYSPFCNSNFNMFYKKLIMIRLARFSYTSTIFIHPIFLILIIYQGIY